MLLSMIFSVFITEVIKLSVFDFECFKMSPQLLNYTHCAMCIARLLHFWGVLNRTLDVFYCKF